MNRLKGRYADSGAAVKLLQWFAAIFVLTMAAVSVWTLMPDRQTIEALKLLQALQSAATFLFPPLLMAYLWSSEPQRWLHTYKLPASKQAVIAVATMTVAVPAVNLLAWLNSQIALPGFMEGIESWMRQTEEQAMLLTERFMSTTTVTGLTANLLIMALLPAVAEELTFRGVLLNLFSRSTEDVKKISDVAIWAVAILFSAIHMQFYGFIPRMLLGALFGYALKWSDSLWLPILMHFTNNALAVIFSFICISNGYELSGLDAIGTEDTLWIGCVSMVITIAGIAYLYKTASGKETQEKV